jgi:Pyridine nucleotide-disulphide oxidoreductase
LSFQPAIALVKVEQLDEHHDHFVVDTTIIKVRSVNEATDRTVSLPVPTAMTASDMVTGAYASLASLNASLPVISHPLSGCGVIFHLGDTAVAINGKRATLKSGGVLEADIVVVGVGVRPCLALAEQAGLALDPASS